jgi:hypothetical protein
MTQEHEENFLLAKRVPRNAARIVREVIARECDSDVKSQDTVFSRGTSLLAAAGVSITILFRMLPEAGSCSESVLLLVSIVIALATIAFAVLAMLVTTASTKMRKENLTGADIDAPHLSTPDNESTSQWLAFYDQTLIAAYLDIRHERSLLHEKRTTRLKRAQISYTAFMLIVLLLATIKIAHHF